jgi:hypothetical protein
MTDELKTGDGPQALADFVIQNMLSGRPVIVLVAHDDRVTFVGNVPMEQGYGLARQFVENIDEQMRPANDVVLN